MRVFFTALLLACFAVQPLQAKEPIQKPLLSSLEELDKAGFGVGYQPAPAPSPVEDPYVGRSELSASDRAKYDRCMDESTSKPTEAGVRIHVGQCRERFLRKPQVSK